MIFKNGAVYHFCALVEIATSNQDAFFICKICTANMSRKYATSYTVCIILFVYCIITFIYTPFLLIELYSLAKHILFMWYYTEHECEAVSGGVYSNSNQVRLIRCANSMRTRDNNNLHSKCHIFCLSSFSECN